MKVHAASLLACVLTLAACDKPEDDVTITETRPLTTRDGTPKLNASSDERFRDAKPSPVQGDTPDGWLKLPSSQFRLLNYRFGASGTGEVWVSLSQGSVLDNANRWLEQFSAKAVTEEELAKLPTVAIAGASGRWITAEGDYAGGMGAPPRDGFGLAGVIAQTGGQILTVKMVGPAAEVQAAKPVLEIYAKSLRMAE
jgi:hypothetical protein